MIKKIPLFLLFFLCLQVLPAQKKIILETIRCRSIKGPLMVYWQNEETRKNFALQLNTLLLKYYHAPLADTSNLNIIVLNEDTKSNKSVKYSVDADTGNVHMYLDIFENTPPLFFASLSSNTEDSSLMKRAKSFLQLQLVLLKKDSTLFNNTLDIIVTTGNTPGIGVIANTVALTPKSFVETLKAALNILLNSANELAQIEVKVAPAFLADNYILSKTTHQPRVYVSTTKDICTYSYKNTNEIIRLGDAVYEQIIMRGRKADKLPIATEEAIRKTAHASLSDYVFLKQEGRDVLRNKNYQLKLLTQIDPENPPVSNAVLFTNFLAGNSHYLLTENDTVAVFAIEKAVMDTDKKIFINAISNGYDSASYTSIDTQQPVWPVLYDYVVKGKINKQNFSIKCSGFGNTIKEIYLDDKLTCIAQGKFIPEKFVLFDASLSPELLNPLLMIGFNKFFE